MNKPLYHLCVKVFKPSQICHSRVMRWRLGGCKLTRRVLNYEQAANEPTAYTASILSMGYFRELIRSEIFLGGPWYSARGQWCNVDYQCSLSFFFLTGMCAYLDRITASDILKITSSWYSESQSECSGLQAAFILIFNATDGKISWLMS